MSALAKLEALLGRVQANRQKPRVVAHAAPAAELVPVHEEEARPAPVVAHVAPVAHYAQVPPSAPPAVERRDDPGAHPTPVRMRSPVPPPPQPTKTPTPIDIEVEIAEPPPPPAAAPPVPPAPPVPSARQAPVAPAAAEPVKPAALAPPSAPVARAIGEAPRVVPATFGALVDLSLRLRPHRG